MVYIAFCNAYMMKEEKLTSKSKTLISIGSVASPTVCEKGYRAIAAFDMDFFAVGTDGTVALISSEEQETILKSPVTVNLHDVIVVKDTVWMVGDAGILLSYHKEVGFTTYLLDSTVNFWTLVSFGESLLIGGTEGMIYRLAIDDIKACAASQDNKISEENGQQLFRGEAVSLHNNMTSQRVIRNGAITGLAASDSLCIGVSNTGEVMYSKDGETWSYLDYNVLYKDNVNLGHLVYADGLFYASGSHADGSPIVLKTLLGGVWSERAIHMIEGKPQDISKLKVHGMAWDGQQLIAACNDGQMLVLPDCVKCNKLMNVTTEELTDVVYHGGRIAMVGDNFVVKVMDTDGVRQYKISAETTFRYQQEGAVILDVRDKEDYEEKHIAGSISLPLSQLEENIRTVVPDQSKTIVFYCTKGIRSQTACELARKLQYPNVYSLGEMENWSYEFDEAE
ncbi:MAG: putative phage shock protein [Herbinix sp.]|nr:putative phage shock protein [Herbinix sp.]